MVGNGGKLVVNVWQKGGERIVNQWGKGWLFGGKRVVNCDKSSVNWP